MIRQIESLTRSPLTVTQPGSHPLGEHYATLLRSVRSLRSESGVCIGVTSCARQEGVTTVAGNLAVAAAQAGDLRVLLADTNAVHPELAGRFGILTELGFSDLVAGKSGNQDVFHRTTVDQLWVLPAGREPATLADHPALKARLDELRAKFDLTIVDLPVANDLSPCGALARLLDGVLLVVEAERLHRDEVRRAKARLQRSQANLLGVVFNKGRR
jgi:succinoglycan biosynthesis transport protein ExoP